MGLPLNVFRVSLRAIGSFFVILSGLILFSDKIFSFHLKNNFGFADTETFLWVASQSISPLLLVLCIALKPFKISYIVPVYIYIIQLVWVFSPDLKIDDPLLQAYAIGSVTCFIVVVSTIAHYFNKAYQKSKLEKALDLDLNETIRRLIHFIVIDVKRDFIHDTDKKHYTKTYMNALKNSIKR